MSDDFVSRREFDQHIKTAAETQVRLDEQLRHLREDYRSMNDHGTTGVQVLQTQVLNLVASFAELKSEVHIFQDKHERQHEAEETDRKLDKDNHNKKHEEDKRDQARYRYWGISVVLVAIGTLAYCASLLIDILHRVHG